MDRQEAESKARWVVPKPHNVNRSPKQQQQQQQRPTSAGVAYAGARSREGRGRLLRSAKPAAAIVPTQLLGR